MVVTSNDDFNFIVEGSINPIKLGVFGYLSQ